MLYVRNLHSHSYSRIREKVVQVENLIIGLSNIYYVMFSQSAQI